MNDIIYADVPKDLMKIKTKFLFNLTKQADFDKEVKAIVRASVQKKRKAGNTPA